MRRSVPPLRPMADPTIYRSEAARHEIEALYDRARERLPFATSERMVPTRFGETHVLEAGPEDGPPVVVFQGGNVVSPLTLAWFAPLVDRFRIHAPDTIGQPGKSAGTRVSANDASLGEWAVDVHRRPRARGTGRRRDLVRWRGRASTGRRSRPERIGRAVLVVPAGIADVPIGVHAVAGGRLPRLSGDRRASSFVESTVRRLSGGDPDPLFVESTALAFRGTALDTEMPRNATPDELRGLTAPVMVIAGEHDPLFRPDRVLPRAKALFPNLVGDGDAPGVCATSSDRRARDAWPRGSVLFLDGRPGDLIPVSGLERLRQPELREQRRPERRDLGDPAVDDAQDVELERAMDGRRRARGGSWRPSACGWRRSAAGASRPRTGAFVSSGPMTSMPSNSIGAGGIVIRRSCAAIDTASAASPRSCASMKLASSAAPSSLGSPARPLRCACAGRWAWSVARARWSALLTAATDRVERRRPSRSPASRARPGR